MKAVGVVEPKHLVTTHKHLDHSGGNDEMKKTFPNLKIYGGKDDDIASVTQEINHLDKQTIGGLEMTALHTPCHTRGHILFYFEGAEGQKLEYTKTVENGYVKVSNVDRLVFTGDTIFLGGCGRFFEGQPHEMVTSLDLAMAHLPDDAKVFCGHEYTEANIKFCLKAEPSNTDLLESKLKHYLDQKQ